MTTPNPPESATEAQGRALSDCQAAFILWCPYKGSPDPWTVWQAAWVAARATPTDAARAPAPQDAQALRAWIEGAWCAGYYDAGYTHDSAYAHKRAEEFADAALTQSAPQASQTGCVGPADRKLPCGHCGSLPGQSCLAFPVYVAPLQAEPEASGNASDTVQLFGVRSDGTEVLVGAARTPPKMMAREIVRQMFGEIDEEAGDAGAMALWCCEQLIDWLGVPAIADARATTATPAAREAEAERLIRLRRNAGNPAFEQQCERWLAASQTQPQAKGE